MRRKDDRAPEEIHKEQALTEENRANQVTRIVVFFVLLSFNIVAFLLEIFYSPLSLGNIILFECLSLVGILIYYFSYSIIRGSRRLLIRLNHPDSSLDSCDMDEHEKELHYLVPLSHVIVAQLIGFLLMLPQVISLFN